MRILEVGSGSFTKEILRKLRSMDHLDAHTFEAGVFFLIVLSHS